MPVNLFTFVKTTDRGINMYTDNVHQQEVTRFTFTTLVLYRLLAVGRTKPGIGKHLQYRFKKCQDIYMNVSNGVLQGLLKKWVTSPGRQSSTQILRSCYWKIAATNTQNIKHAYDDKRKIWYLEHNFVADCTYAKHSSNV